MNFVHAITVINGETSTTEINLKHGREAGYTDEETAARVLAIRAGVAPHEVTVLSIHYRGMAV